MKYFRILSVIVLTIAVSGCFAGKQPEQPAWGGSEEWRLKSLEENFLNFKEGIRAQKHQIESNHNETTAQITQLQDRMAKLDDTLAELKSNQQKMLAMNAEKDIVPVVPVQITEEVTADVVAGGSESSEEKPWMNVPGDNSAPAGATAAKPDVAAAQPEATAPQSPLKGDALYQEGVRLVLSDRPLESRALLTQYLQQNPTAKLSPNALYWIGETYYSEKSFAQSILKFKEVSRRFPKADKVPAAMLKIGLAYDKLGDRENALFYLRTLIEDYPNSDPARIGRSRLSEIES